MKRGRDDEKIVYQSLAMIMQFGLNMIVPVCMMSALGIWLDRKFGTSFWTILLFAVGAVAGGQNIYRIAKRMCSSQDAANTSEASSEASNKKNGRSFDKDQQQGVVTGSGKENKNEQSSRKAEESK